MQPGPMIPDQVFFYFYHPSSPLYNVPGGKSSALFPTPFWNAASKDNYN